MAEWFKAPVLKTGRGFTLPRGFESHPFRHWPHSRPFAVLRHEATKPLIIGITEHSFLFTRSPSFAIIRLIIVDRTVDRRFDAKLGGMAMARAIGRLTALKVEKAKEPGMYADGGGLYLRVTPEGARNWVLRYMLDRRPRWMGLGPLALYGLQEARAKALDARRKRHEGIDPIEARRAERARQRLDAAKAITFKQCAESLHRRAPRRMAQRQARRAMGGDACHLCLSRSSARCRCRRWTPALCSRCWNRSGRRSRKRQAACAGASKAFWTSPRCAAIATAKTRRAGAAISTSCCRRAPRCAQVEHHAALPYAELPAFLASLREQEGIAARALEFAILTAARTGEVIGARWNEIDLLDKTWTVPAARMKAHREHRVPLSPRALAILDEMQAARQGDAGDAFVFPGGKAGKPLSNMAFLMLLRRMGRGDLTAHGFRATFKTWASERTSFQNEIVEASLAHTIGGKVEQAYHARRHVREAAPAHAAMGDVLHHRARPRAARQRDAATPESLWRASHAEGRPAASEKRRKRTNGAF